MIRKDDKKEGRRSNGLLEVIRVTPLPIKSFLQLITTGLVYSKKKLWIDLKQSQDKSSHFICNWFFINTRRLLSIIFNWAWIHSSIHWRLHRRLCQVILHFHIPLPLSLSFSKSISALGFGAKLPPIDRESQQFCLVRT